jgi:RNA polymerase sigma-70 factor (ECF subfamily)
MARSGGSTASRIDELLRRLQAGDAAARDALVDRSIDRLTLLARRQLREFGRVARWEQTEDVVQAVACRLHRALSKVNPASSRDFFNLCSRHIRFELIELHRKHFGPHGIGAHYASPGPATSGSNRRAAPDRIPDSTYDPAKLARWTELHQQVAALPDELRQVFDLIWYHDLTHREAADVLGITAKTVQRRWREARLKLHHLVDDS